MHSPAFLKKKLAAATNEAATKKFKKEAYQVDNLPLGTLSRAEKRSEIAQLNAKIDANIKRKADQRLKEAVAALIEQYGFDAVSDAVLEHNT